MYILFVSGLTCLFFFLTINFTLPVRADTIVRSDRDDIINIIPGNHTVDGKGGNDTIKLPFFPNLYTFIPTGPTQYTVKYLGYVLSIDNIEYVEFGVETQTKLSIYGMPSGEVQTKLANLTDLYLAFFGRAPDVSGLEYWQEQLLGKGRNLAFISMDFAWSAEAQALFPLGESNRTFVKTVYQNCFGRDPDPAGWDYWTNKLDKLNTADPSFLNDRGAFVGELLLGAYAPTSGEEDRNLLINRHEVAMDYVNWLSMQPDKGFDDAINDLLARVTGDLATQDKAKHVIGYIFGNPSTLANVMNNSNLLNQLWAGVQGTDDIDNDGDGYSVNQGDCNDASASIKPGATDTCGDGIDQDCSGADLQCTPVKSLNGLAITGGTLMNENAILSLAAMASWSDGTTSDVTTLATWSATSTVTTAANGQVTAGEVAADTTVTITASYTFGGSPQSDTHSVTVKNFLPVCTDADGDGYAVQGGACGLIDCNDSNANIRAGAIEICGDGIDQDCSGQDSLCAGNPALIGLWELVTENGQPIPADLSVVVALTDNNSYAMAVLENSTGNSCLESGTYGADATTLTITTTETTCEASETATSTVSYQVSGNTLTMTDTTDGSISVWMKGQGTPQTQLIGTWGEMSVTGMDFYNTFTNLWSEPTGGGARYEFNPDGTYTYALLVQYSLPTCSSKTWIWTAGSFSANGNSLTLTQTENYKKLRNTCGTASYYDGPMPLVNATYAWSIKQIASPYVGEAWYTGPAAYTTLIINNPQAGLLQYRKQE